MDDPSFSRPSSPAKTGTLHTVVPAKSATRPHTRRSLPTRPVIPDPDRGSLRHTQPCQRYKGCGGPLHTRWATRDSWPT